MKYSKVWRLLPLFASEASRRFNLPVESLCSETIHSARYYLFPDKAFARKLLGNCSGTAWELLGKCSRQSPSVRGVWRGLDAPREREESCGLSFPFLAMLFFLSEGLATVSRCLFDSFLLFLCWWIWSDVIKCRNGRQLFTKQFAWLWKLFDFPSN